MSDETPMRCPKCGGDLTGKPIPEKDRHFYGGSTHFSNVLGHYDRERDRVVSWACPLCGHTWERDVPVTKRSH